MAGINYGRVLLGGLAAGVVANACDAFTGMVLMADDMQRMAQRLSLDPNVINAPSVAVTWIVVDFLYATLIVWTYAAIRPRFGPGPKTAALAALVICLAVTVVLSGFVAMGIFTQDLYLKSAAFSLVTAVLAGLTGGYVYKEA